MITVDANSLEARYGKVTGNPPPKEQELHPTTPLQMGEDIPEGVVVRQYVGRGQAPPMAVVPPKNEQGPQPSMAVIPPTGSNRTSIGTFVDPPVEPVEEPAPVEPVRTEKRQLDLAQLMLDHIFELGGEKSEEAQKFYDRSPQTLVNWCKNPAAIPLGAIVKYISRKPGVKTQLLEELEPHFVANGEESYAQMMPTRSKVPVMVCAPVLERPTLPFMWTLLYLAKKYEVGFDIQSDTMINRSRNMLAHRFLQSNQTWSLWIDSDIAAPIANPDWFKWITRAQNVPEEYTSYDVLTRLLSHNKPIVGGVYASRQAHGKLVIQPEIKPRSQEDRLLCNEIRRGTARGLQAVEWIGFGCALVHREVFLELQRRFPQLAPRAEFEPWRFFHVEGDEGEDEAFCTRCRVCSIPIWLDSQLICGHIGPQVFLPEHTQASMAL